MAKVDIAAQHWIPDSRYFLYRFSYSSAKPCCETWQEIDEMGDAGGKKFLLALLCGDMHWIFCQKAIFSIYEKDCKILAWCTYCFIHRFCYRAAYRINRQWTKPCNKTHGLCWNNWPLYLHQTYHHSCSGCINCLYKQIEAMIKWRELRLLLV